MMALLKWRWDGMRGWRVCGADQLGANCIIIKKGIEHSAV